MDGDIFQYLIFTLFFCAVILVIILAWLLEMRRRKAIKQWAEANGLSFTSERDRSFDDTFPNFHCLQRGSNRYAKNIIYGDWNSRYACIFDYYYTTGSGKNKHTHSFTGVMLNVGIPMPHLLIRGESFFDKVGEFIGFDDIDFEFKEFNDKYYVKSKDKKFAYDIVNPKMIEYLLTQPITPIEFSGQNVLTYESTNKKLKPGEIEDKLAFLEEIIKRFPDYLIKEFQGTSL